MKRILSLLLALTLLVSLLVLPASAATAKEVHTFLKNVAMEGSYSSDYQWWHSDMALDDEGDLWFGVYYLTQTGYIELSIYTDQFEVTWRISSNPSPAYNAYILLNDSQGSKGTVSIGANYSGAAYGSFSNFTGDTNYRSAMLEALNEVLPMVVELTRAVINDNNYTLRDLGLTAYTVCKYFHAYDGGRVTKEPTCAAAGTRTYTCRVCGNTATEEIPATNQHTWDNGVIQTAPSCMNGGVKRFTCTVCHTATRDESIPPLGHSWDAGSVTTEPGCTTEGVKTFTCTRCGGTRDEAIAALGHVWIYTETLTPAEDGAHGTALYTCSRCSETKEGRLCAAEVFTDMPADDYWAHTPIDWAYFNGITKGKTDTTFAPKAKITRAEVMTFLWTVAGKPEPTLTESPFTDVTAGKYYYKPVLWAVENHITTGKTETSFAPKAQCSRAEIMTFLWTAVGRPEHTLEESPFTDVTAGKYYYNPILWAFENKVTGGTTETTFSPKAICTRAQVVTFLYKVKDLLTEEPSTVLDWCWDLYEGEGMDRCDLYPGDSDVLRIFVEGDEAPVLSTDKPELLELLELGRNESLEEQGSGEKVYEWQIRVIGRGAAAVSCSMGGTEVRSLVIDSSDDTPSFVSAEWLVGEETSTEDPFTLSAEEPNLLLVVMNYPTLPEGEAALDPDSYELPVISCDQPELLEIQLSDNPVSGLGGHQRGFLWRLSPLGSGSAQLSISFREETVRTLNVVLP